MKIHSDIIHNCLEVQALAEIKLVPLYNVTVFSNRKDFSPDTYCDPKCMHEP